MAASALFYKDLFGVSYIAIGIGAYIMIITLSNHLNLRKTVYFIEEFGVNNPVRLKLAQLIRAVSERNDCIFSVKGMPLGVDEVSEFVAHSVGGTLPFQQLRDEVLSSIQNCGDGAVLYKNYIMPGKLGKKEIAARSLYDEWGRSGGLIPEGRIMEKTHASLVGELTKGTKIVSCVGSQDRGTLDSVMRDCSPLSARFALSALTGSLKVIFS